MLSIDALFPADDWVESEMTAYLNGVDPVPARLLYDQADPWAVTLVLDCGASGEREWVFSRDLLASGMLAAVGEGDVRINPEDDVVWVLLTSPSGHAELAFSRAALEKALEKTEDLVPPGREPEFFDWDREWHLLTGEAA
ncbi:SsgA family sporulation/cell division regulator [Amycolatopsis echigonensis]|uniref:Sporulation and cell division protein SsgA n=1 Tax=Amycolatopsis echigonensis TaxID=2576905 RepID=A0A2N3WE68_9PSEU|nr:MULTISPECIES: SsgA family sporulation/cell division regulator [Amycolatopsis]MBB2499647.1 SsgA family sporulation/cell division regulator [Amycolatopsis echigonensis]PKV92194.1 sporulation and cell division protein SsgA [Amycolatopsis niigatensis]